ncbi:MAG: GtrA family protein [Caldicoprobacterales bacterium]|jgi:putative flippase GtrA|nr:GtrA family protein [Clostridiales bacterium]
MKKKIELQQLMKFGLVGFLNTGVDFLVFTLLTMAFGLHAAVSHVISYSCGVINSFLLNRFWTFQKKGRSRPAQFVKFVLVNLVSLGLSTLVLNLLETRAGLSVYPAKIGAVLCSMAVNFAGSKMIVFRDE